MAIIFVPRLLRTNREWCPGTAVANLRLREEIAELHGGLTHQVLVREACRGESARVGTLHL